MTEPNNIEDALRGICPECGSTWPGHAEMAVLHGHGAAEQADGLRLLLADQAGVDPSVIEMTFTPLGEAREGEPREGLLDMFAPLNQREVPRMAPYPMPPMRSKPLRWQPAVIGLGTLAGLIIGGFVMSLWVIDRMVKQLIKSFPHWNQD